MPIIKCGNNRIAADDPELDDTHVQVVWIGRSEDGIHGTIFHGPLEPIENYEEAVAWAVEMAPYMVQPLYVVPLTGAQVLGTEQVQRGFEKLTPWERGELRQLLVATLAQIMRDCDDPIVRADAHEVLVQLRVVKE